MKLSPFMKEHKKNLKKLTKEQLIKQVLIWIETMAHQDICNDNLIWYNTKITKELNELEQTLRSAENALDYKDKVIERYKTLLSVSVEDL